MSTNEKAKLHSGHRERMRERFEKAGPESLADHELLEMLLFYTQPRRDTNEAAHALIEECGSLSSVLESPTERLCRVPQIGSSSALYLRLLGELSRRYTVEKLRPQTDPMQVTYDDADKIAAYLFPRFLGQKTERMLALLFDSGMHLLDCFTVGQGSINSVSVTVRAVAQRAYQRDAAFVVLAHNHPGGVAMPSAEDIRLTRDFDAALSLVDIPLIEHFIFTERSYFPILSHYASDAAESQNTRAAQFRRSLNKKAP